MISLLVLIVVVAVIAGGWWGLPLLAALISGRAVNDKASAIRQVADLMHDYEISIAEIDNAINNPASDPQQTRRSGGEIAKTLFSYLGGIFILAGVGTYLGMFWDSMGSLMRVGVTLGTGYALLIVLITALHEKKYPQLIMPVALAAAVMLTGGWFVFIDEFFHSGSDWRLAVLAVFALMAIHQAVLFYRYRLTELALTALFFVYGFFNTALDLIGVSFGFTAITLGSSLFLVAGALDKSPHRILSEPAYLISTCWLCAGLFDELAWAVSPEWATLSVGLCAMSTAYGMQRAGRHLRLTHLGYLVGSIMLYAGLFDVLHATSIETLFFAVTVAMLYACVVLKSRVLLFTTIAAMLGFIGYFSSEYFVDSLGWPVTLVLLGVIFFGISILAMRIKRQI